MRNKLNLRKLTSWDKLIWTPTRYLKERVRIIPTRERERAAKFKSGLYEALKWLLIAVTQVEPFIESVI